MPESRSKSKSAFRRSRKLKFLALAGVLLAVLLVAFFGRFISHRKQDPNYSLKDLFKKTSAEASRATLPSLPTLPGDFTLDPGGFETGAEESTAPEETDPEETESEGMSDPEDSSEVTEAPESSEETESEELTESEAESTEENTEEPTAGESEDTTEEESTEEESSDSTETDVTEPEETTAAETADATGTDPSEDPSTLAYHLKNAGLTEKDLKGTKQLIVAQSDGTECMLYFFDKGEDGWAPTAAVAPARGALGRAGVVPADQKTEGDNCTPAGYFALGPCYGEESSSLTAMEYHQIKKGDYWVDDPGSRYYNKLYRSSMGEQDWNSAEDLHELLNFYKYAVQIRYNTDPIVPGKGSCIFLHVQDDIDTSGCICSKSATLFSIFMWLTPDADPHILIY